MAALFQERLTVQNKGDEANVGRDSERRTAMRKPSKNKQMQLEEESKGAAGGTSSDSDSGKDEPQCQELTPEQLEALHQEEEKEL